MPSPTRDRPDELRLRTGGPPRPHLPHPAERSRRTPEPVRRTAAISTGEIHNDPRPAGPFDGDAAGR
ncbi:hypothetical protein ACFV2H_34310 [Streptomyces sp. NPDC059629]|uniref:hypothetical protein n=1 Tax=Streptomyces sp. NPDC059629 TaxID=3346889 RepID=UPI0036B36269